MSVDEVFALIKTSENEKKERWEQVRQICYYVVAPHSKNITSPQDLFKFEWEKENAKPKKVNKRMVKKNSKRLERWLNVNSQ